MRDHYRRLVSAAASLVVIQIVHGAIPADTSAEGYVGLVLGTVALIASITALVGASRRRPWAAPLLGLTGASVAVGFLLYHALPIHSAFTNPYFGEDKIGALQWTPVIASIGIGLWCAWEATRARDPFDSERVLAR